MTSLRLYIAIIVLLLCTLACGLQLPTKQASTASLVYVPEAKYQIVEVTGNVYIRNQAGEITGLVAEKGMRLVGYVDGDYFRLLSGETVFIGCVDISERGCLSK